jgi:hypothetical protein
MSNFGTAAIAVAGWSILPPEDDKPPRWHCYISADFCLTHKPGEQPNAFQRKMQEVFFGWKWVRIE